MADNLDELTNRFKSSAENFSLAPSPSTWEKVEREIGGRERKRRFVILFLLGGALLLGGAVWFINSPAGRKNVVVQNQNSVSTLPSIEEQQKKPASSIADERSSYGKKNSETIPVSQKQLKTASSQKEAGQLVQGKFNDSRTTDRSIPGNENESTHKVPAKNEIETKKIISPETALLSLASEIKTNDSLKENAVKDSLSIVHLVDLNKDSVPAKKDTVTESSFARTWSLTYGAALATSFTTFSEDGDYQFVAHYRDSSDKAVLTQNLHFNISYRAFPRLEIFTGMGLVNYQERMLNKQVVYRDDTLPVSGPLPPAVVKGKGFYHISGDSLRGVTNKFFYLQVPVGVRYTVYTRHKWNIGVQPEISFNKAIYTKGYMYSDATREYKAARLTDLQALNIGYGIGIPFWYELNNKLQLEMMPCFFGMQRSVFSSTLLSQKFQQVEARVSLHYTFPE